MNSKFSVYRGLLLMILSLLLWNIPATHTYLKQADVSFAKLLNSTLDNHALAEFWGFFNQSFESYLNALAMLVTTLVYIIYSKNKIRTLSNVLLLLVYLNICFGIKKYIIVDLFDVYRDSPSLSIDGFVRLSELFPNQRIKDSASRSFIGDHAFAMFFWIFFTSRFMSNQFHLVIKFLGVFFSLPRMFSGTHWLSDTLFAIFAADFLVHIVTSTPLYDFFVTRIEKSLLRVKGFSNLAKK